jgi:hypothetical protein
MMRVSKEAFSRNQNKSKKMLIEKVQQVIVSMVVTPIVLDYGYFSESGYSEYH